ncbi:ABC transporter substrate-binding protein [Rhizobium sp. AC44/96]|uniref:sugar ABC transporter substrate-binding protein n=1 Tax=Rhizobium sp. AC44/96 TaxID=1841654 RepID=UPI00080FAAD8|nr:substrate-binding domain-containing protein [Rhizobium sp. AC44/96]OCJ14440.1 ABC transporter substrate-binding protein [Rhizobium sp. AC44/96]
MKNIVSAALLAFAALTGQSQAADDKPVFYVISHGGETDPFWIDWNAGAQEACRELAVTCNISFSGGDFAVQKEAFNAALASKPAGIATTSAQPGLWKEEVVKAKDEKIPLVFFNSDDKDLGRLAYVGADLRMAGETWAHYLVDKGLVKAGAKVFLPVEVPGASYQQLETQGIASVFDPLGIKYDVVEAGTDPAGVIQKMSEYLVANKVDAVIALGDLVASSVQRVFDNNGISPGSIPVVGWGNSKETAQAVKAGYVNAALWQYPFDQGYMPILQLKLAHEGHAIGYDIFTMKLYDKDTVEPILQSYAKK